MKYDYDANVLNFTTYMNNVFSLEGKTILDIGCGDGEMVKMIASKYNPRHITGADLYLRVNEENNDTYSLMNGVNSCELPFEDNSFDFIYSISTFEHIANVSGTLAEIRRVLKPMGKFYSSFAPLWTSVAGHHVYCVQAAMRDGMDRDEEVVDAIPAWGHLYMSEDEMHEHLEKTSITEERVQAILKYIYHGNDINRHTATQTRNDFINSKMIIRKYCERVSFSRQWALDRKGPSELTEDILTRIKGTHYNPDDIGITSMQIELEKYASI